MVRDFTYIRIWHIYITEFILIILLVKVLISLIRNKLLYRFNSQITVALIFLLGYQTWGVLRLIYDLLFFRPSVTSENDILSVLRNFSLVYYSILIYLSAYLFYDEIEKKVEWVFKTILFFSLLRNIVVLFLYLMGLENYIPEDGGIIGGPPSLISVFSSIISIYFWFKYKSFSYFILSGLSIFFVILSGHRSAMLSLVVSLFIFFFINKKFSVLRVGLTLLISLLFVFSVVYFSPLLYLSLERIYTNFISFYYYRTTDPNAHWRYLYWSNTIKAITENPIGLGFAYSLTNLAPWEVWYENPRELIYRSSLRLDPHNSYIAILARTGVLGFTFFLIFLLTSFAIILKNLKIIKNKNYLLVALFSNFVAVFVFAFFNVTLEGPYHGVFFWIWLGISLILSQKIKN
ncbi:O-antigen ligase family protein [Candidatus Chrysopegis kryptomonas]|uniref:O-Antigen ligase n=1 Tax=Candidatus Chryseopegocella kryptomonas TaxID=1633643 RepID=A0A0P1MXJ3_9BACT|nr:O-antigen ligase family protein [Candidatus Chrysopegis kryptomonas]CUT00830.1 O-Antigen ligase [Candidatus Chrysopegis kryptomonas]